MRLSVGSVVAKSPSRSARRWTGAAAPVHADAARRRRSLRARLCASWQRSLAWGCRAHRDNRVTALASMSSLNSYRAGEADRCAVGSSDLEATSSIIIAQRACPAESEPVHPSQASSYWHDVVDVEPDPDQETEDDTTAVIATRSLVGYWKQFVIATLANCAQTERCRPNEKKPPEFPWCRSSDTLSITREANRRNAKKPPGLLPQNGRSPGGIQKG